MAIIDADTHVIETERTWDYMAEDERAFKPMVVVPKEGDSGDTGITSLARSVQGRQEFWLIEGRAYPKRTQLAGTEMSEGACEMSDVGARLAHMDELGVDVHVLYPTIVIWPLTRRPEVEVALWRSYNRWMADIWEQERRRLRWMALLPLMSIDKALEELHWAKEHGACGVVAHPIEGEKRLSDLYFHPLYQEMGELDMPLCVHATVGNFDVYDLYARDSGFSTFKLPVVGAFHDLLMKGVPERFPKMRWGFMEVSSQWLPYAMNDLEIRFCKGSREWLGSSLLRENHMYIACQTADDPPYVLGYAGDENIVIGSDYGHNDTSSEVKAPVNLKTKGNVDSATIDKILDANARRLYAL